MKFAISDNDDGRSFVNQRTDDRFVVKLTDSDLSEKARAINKSVSTSLDRIFESHGASSKYSDL